MIYVPARWELRRPRYRQSILRHLVSHEDINIIFRCFFFFFFHSLQGSRRSLWETGRTRTAWKPVNQFNLQLFLSVGRWKRTDVLSRATKDWWMGWQLRRKEKESWPILKLPWPSKPASCFMGDFTTKPWMIQKTFKDCLQLVLLVHENMLLLGSDVASMLWVMNCTDCKHSWESSSAIPNCFLSLAYFIIWFFTGRKKSYIKNRALLLFLAPALLGSWFLSLSFLFFSFFFKSSFIWRASDHPSLSRKSPCSLWLSPLSVAILVHGRLPLYCTPFSFPILPPALLLHVHPFCIRAQRWKYL